MTSRLKNPDQMVHVRYNGRSVEILLSDLDLGPYADDRTLRGAVAEFLGIPVGKLANYAVDRHVTGNYTVRPQAVFG